MGLNAVQHHVQGILDGLALPGQLPALVAWIQPPAMENLDGPKCYIWGGRMRGRRQTIPRGGGFQEYRWKVDAFLSYETVSDTTHDPVVDQEFPLVIDAVMKALRTDIMPVAITDPTTGEVSQMLEIGEDFELEYPPERTPNTMRMVYYVARLQTEVLEVVQA